MYTIDSRCTHHAKEVSKYEIYTIFLCDIITSWMCFYFFLSSRHFFFFSLFIARSFQISFLPFCVALFQIIFTFIFTIADYRVRHL